MLTKLAVEAALNAELTDHPGHEKNAPKKALIPAIATRQKPCFAIILIACVDGLKGFPNAINSVYPQISIRWRALGKPEHVLRLPAGYPQDDLHHKRYRTTGDLSGDQAGV